MFRGTRVQKLPLRLSAVVGIGLLGTARPGWAQTDASPPSATESVPGQDRTAEPPTSGEGEPQPDSSATSDAAEANPPGLPPNTVSSPPAYYAEPLETDGPDGGGERMGPLPPPSSPEREARTHSAGRSYPGGGQPVHIMVPEPPPPPVPRHTSPKDALWVGARLGWWVPFGDVWGECVAYDSYGCRSVASVPFDDYASSGPMVEVDLGARLARYYTLYALWERAQLGGGASREAGAQDRAETDFWGLGLRVSTNPDDLGMVVDLAVGARRFLTKWEGGTELQLTDAPFESRLGLGADIRLTRYLSISPLLTLGLGSFSRAEWVGSDGTIRDAIPEDTSRMTHGWLTLQMGGHFELFARR